MTQTLHVLTFVLVILGGINWGLLALTNWEIGSLFGGMDALISQILYILIGASAVYLAVTHKKGCIGCKNRSRSKETASIPG